MSFKLSNNTDHIMTPDELISLATGLVELPERRLMPTWAYVQSVKYNGMLIEGDYAQPTFIFRNIELPLIKRLYPPEMVNPKVKAVVSELAKKTKGYSKKKFQVYLELRKSGLSMERARKEIQPNYSEQFLRKMATHYSLPFTYQYDISCRDADLIYAMGIDEFIRVFYTKFYIPIVKKSYPQS